MNSRTTLALAFLSFLPPVITAQNLAPEITAEDIKTHIRYLASDELGGRASGSPGNEMAARYIARYLHDWGLTPWGTAERISSTFSSCRAFGHGSRKRAPVRGETRRRGCRERRA
jgi:hypothetical protein